MVQMRLAVWARRLVARPPSGLLGVRGQQAGAGLGYGLLPCSASSPSLRRLLSTSSYRPQAIMPDPPATPRPNGHSSPSPPSGGVASLSESDYHELADSYLDIVLAKFETLQDSREDMDVEFSSGVMTITVAGKGTYVINKQPPNKQIWLSSPISGPKRYDWYVFGDGQGDKEGTASGDWICARDGLSLNALIRNELDIVIEESASS